MTTDLDIDESDLSPEAQELLHLLRDLLDEEILTVLRRLFSPERFAYDVSKKWRFVCATPKEHALICRFLGIDITNRVGFGALAEMDARDVDAGKKPRKKRKGTKRGYEAPKDDEVQEVLDEAA